MFSKRSKQYIIILSIFMTPMFTGCLFEGINQPKSAQPGEIIDVSLKITDNIVPEPNAHKGLLGVIVPADWDFVSATYTSVLGNGNLSVSDGWKDSLVKYYPANQFGANMKWIALVSDTGYSYQNTTSFYVQLKLKVGQSLGCFNLGYLTTKAISGMLGTGNTAWAPLSYPHQIGVPDSNLCVNPYSTRRAVEWDDLLDRKSGWTGADGIYSIPLNGYEAPSIVPADSQFFVFSDTFIGQVDSNNHRFNVKMVNNTVALLPNNVPDTSKIKFYWKTDLNGNPKSVFVPATPNANPGDWYWLMDGIALNGSIYVYALRLNSTTGGLGFELNGVVLLKFKLDPVTFIKDIQQFDTPLFVKDTVANWDITLGQALMSMTAQSGNPGADGYIYVYGPKSGPGGKELMAARVLPENIENFSEYRYWNGTNWGSDIRSMAPLTSGISQEFSVTALAANKFLAVFEMGGGVAVRMGDSPVGPFGIFHKVYDCPEILIDPDIFVYNAKAHPNLSSPDELLISYNVNTFDFAGHFSNADIYRPRFIYLTVNDSGSTSAEEMASLPETFALGQNYPNPFNPSTKITFSVPKNEKVSIKVFNALGEMISELTNRYYDAGKYEVDFNTAQNISSGVYFYRMEAGEFAQTKKMILIR